MITSRQSSRPLVAQRWNLPEDTMLRKQNRFIFTCLISWSSIKLKLGAQLTPTCPQRPAWWGRHLFWRRGQRLCPVRSAPQPAGASHRSCSSPDSEGAKPQITIVSWKLTPLCISLDIKKRTAEQYNEQKSSIVPMKHHFLAWTLSAYGKPVLMQILHYLQNILYQNPYYTLVYVLLI